MPTSVLGDFEVLCVGRVLYTCQVYSTWLPGPGEQSIAITGGLMGSCASALGGTEQNRRVPVAKERPVWWEVDLESVLSRLGVSQHLLGTSI